MKKQRKRLTVTISVNPIQADLYLAIRKGEIDLDTSTLREMATIIGERQSPQIIKHHLNKLVSYGPLDIVGGNYKLANGR